MPYRLWIKYAGKPFKHIGYRNRNKREQQVLVCTYLKHNFFDSVQIVPRTNRYFSVLFIHPHHTGMIMLIVCIFA